MTVLYVDTSALLKRYLAECDSEKVVAMMADKELILASIVTRVEVSAAIARALRTGAVDEAGARRAHDKFLDEWPDLMKVPVTNELVARAADVARDYGLRAYDAIQLAGALRSEDALAPLGYALLFATFDKQLGRAALRAGLDTWPK